MSMNIWQFNGLVTRRLFAWNVINMAVGVLMGRSSHDERRGMASQAVGWAGVNFAIAFFGGRATRKREQQANALEATTLAKEARNLKRLLWLNAGLDVGYMLGGWWYAQREAARPFRRGVGRGIIIQGALLLVFDVVHALLVPRHDL